MIMENIETIQMKIELDGIEPDIWRRFVVDSSFTLQELHETIQIVMGWWDSHLYEFEFWGMHFGIPDPDDELLDYEVKDSRKKKLKSLRLNPRDKIKYTYDFGDDWEHTITVEKVMKIGAAPYPICLDGERNCPPEDCGSIPGYEDIVNAMKNPKSKEAKEYAEWLGEPYDPEEFDIKRINTRLKELGKRSPKAKGGRGRKKEIGPANGN
jgi:hypothetical protein